MHGTTVKKISKLKFLVVIRAIMQHFFSPYSDFFEKLIKVLFDLHIVLVH